MNRTQIESWALDIIERIEKQQPIEDSRIELKTDWIDPQKAARRIAGHANAARGDTILWLIGVDEKRGVVGASYEELAKWYSTVQKEFEGLAPSVTDVNIPIRGHIVVALLFETDRAPFVVKNPTGGPISLEVPWRENTSIRSATRTDLLKLLIPLQKTPNLDILDGYFGVEQRKENELAWQLNLTLYVKPKSEDRVVIPFHECEASFEIPPFLPRTQFDSVRFLPPHQFGPGMQNRGRDSSKHTIESTGDEILIDGPGKVCLLASTWTFTRAGIDGDTVIINAKIHPVDASIPLLIGTTLEKATKEHRTGNETSDPTPGGISIATKAKWTVGGRSI